MGLTLVGSILTVPLGEGVGHRAFRKANRSWHGPSWVQST